LKPIVIIVIAVVCSVGAVLGILFIDDLLTQMEIDNYQKFSNKLEKEYNDYLIEVVACADKHTSQYGQSCVNDVKNYFANTVDIVTESYGYEVGVFDEWIYASQQLLQSEYDYRQQLGPSYSSGSPLEDLANIWSSLAKQTKGQMP